MRRPRGFVLALLIPGGAACDCGGGSEAPIENLDAPEAVVERMLQSQVRGDVEGVLAEMTLSELTADGQQDVERTLTAIRDRMAFSDFSFDPRATMMGDLGTMAIVRFTTSVTAAVNGTSSRQTNGSFAVLVRTDDGPWQVRSLLPDEYQNLELWLPKGQGLGSQPLIDWQDVNSKLDETMRTIRLDQGKLLADGVASGIGGLPVFGDFLATAYTVGDMMFGVLGLAEDAAKGRVHAGLLQIAGISWGAVQVITEPIPGVDHMADVVGTVLEQWHFESVLRANYARIDAALKLGVFTDDASGVGPRSPRVLILRLARAGRVSGLELEPPDGWLVPAASKLTFVDEQAAPDGILLFDVGTKVSIGESDSPDLFKAAQELGAEVKLDGMQTVAVLYIRITDIARTSASSGTAKVLDGFAVRGATVKYEVGRVRGYQTLKVGLADGSETVPLTLENRALNLLQDAKAVSKVADDTSVTQDGQVVLTRAGVTKQMGIVGVSPDDPSVELAGLPHVTMGVRDPTVASMTVAGVWPRASVLLTGQKVGSTFVDVFMRGDGATIPPFNASVPVQVAGEASTWPAALARAKSVDLVLQVIPPSGTAEFVTIGIDWESSGVSWSGNSFTFTGESPAFVGGSTGSIRGLFGTAGVSLESLTGSSLTSAPETSAQVELDGPLFFHSEDPSTVTFQASPAAVKKLDVKDVTGRLRTLVDFGGADITACVTFYK